MQADDMVDPVIFRRKHGLIFSVLLDRSSGSVWNIEKNGMCDNPHVI